VVEIVTNDNVLSLFRNPASISLSSQKKTEKIKKIKFGIKIEYFKIKETNFVRAKKDEELN
jgi:hypothetical protein